MIVEMTVGNPLMVCHVTVYYALIVLLYILYSYCHACMDVQKQRKQYFFIMFVCITLDRESEKCPSIFLAFYTLSTFFLTLELIALNV